VSNVANAPSLMLDVLNKITKMKNKTIVSFWLVGIVLSFAGGFISGYNGKEDGLSMLLTFGGTILALIFGIWGMVRLWKTPDKG
jgi:uncharacterized membrane protein YjjP (DUF1212 family)